MRSRERRLCSSRTLVPLLAAVLVLPVRAAPREHWFLASRNHVESGLGVMLVTRDDGSRWLRVLDAALLGIGHEAAPRSSHAGEAIVALDALPIELVLDEVGGRAHFLDRGAPHRIDAGSEELLLDVVVNRQAVSEPQLLTVREGELQISNATLKAAGADVPAQDGSWRPLHDAAGEAFVVDLQQMRLELTLPASMFATTTLNAERAPAAGPRTPSPLAAIVGYDASLGVDGESGETDAAVLLDVAVARGDAGCRSRHLWRDAEGGAARLDTACTMDWPHRALTLGVGDGITRQAVLSAPVRYGGIRFGTDYTLQPYLYTQPVLELEGVARLPSVLEIWMDQQLHLRTDLPPGPFLLDNLPLLTGRGEVEAVVVDALGRRTVVSEPFYADPVLLRPGLTDWGIELGWLRTGALGEDRYADPFGLLTWKRGINDRLTLALRGEMRERGAVLGSSGYVSLGGMGILELGAAGSEHRGRRGHAAVLGYSYRGSRWSGGVRHVRRSESYADLAWPLPGQAPRKETVVGGGMRLGRASLSINAAAREAGDGTKQALATAAVSMAAGPGYLTLSATHMREPRNENSALVLYTLPLASGASVSGRLAHDEDGLQPGVVYQRAPPQGPGFGLRAGAERRADGTAASVDMLWRGSRAEADASLLHHRGRTQGRVGVSGAAVITGAGVFAAPDDGGSFALVSLPAPGARILHDNQVVSVTDSRGRALLSRVRAFERNRIAVAVEDLPVNLRIAVPEIDVVPGRRQVAAAKFDAAAVQYLAASLQTGDGKAVPAGATARIGETSFPVGHGGLLFAEVDALDADIVVIWQGRTLCRVAAARLPDAPDATTTYPLACEDEPDAP